MTSVLVKVVGVSASGVEEFLRILDRGPDKRPHYAQQKDIRCDKAPFSR